MPSTTSQLGKFPKWAKIVAIVMGAIVALLILLWVLAGWYINSHKAALLQKLTTSVSQNLNGEFKIGNMKPAFFKGFPDVALELEDVSLGDSMVEVHHKNLFEFKHIYVKFNLFSMLGGSPHISRIMLNDGQMNLFTDSSGFTNGYLLKGKENNNGKKTSKKKLEFGAFGLDNVLFTFQNDQKLKKIQFLAKTFSGDMHESGSKIYITSNTDIHIDQLGFNLENGGFLRDKEFGGELHIVYDEDKGDLMLPYQQVRIGKTKLKIDAVFHFKEQPTNFEIKVDAPSIDYKEGVSYVSQNIAAKLKQFSLAKPIALQVALRGKFKGPDTPYVHARWQTTQNDFQTNFGILKNASFAGTYLNEYTKGKGRGDDNSIIFVDKLSASYMNIPIVADSIRLFNLLHPLLDFNLTSGFPVQQLNQVLNHTFDFTKGTASIAVHYHGGITTHDSLGHSLVGGVKIKDAAFTYVPHQIHFSEGNIDLDFTGADLIVKNSTLSTGKSDLTLRGEALQFMNVYFNDPQKAVFNWYLHSDTINLQEFEGLLRPGKAKAEVKRQGHHHVFNERLELLMEKSKMNVQASIDRLYYHSFQAKQVKGVLDMDQASIALKPLSMKFADGAMTASVSLVAGDQDIPFSLKANLADINISKLFYGLDNLGQNTITSKNIAGKFTGDINVNGRLNNQSKVVKNSLNGSASFLLTDGQLINFGPFESIQKFVFKKRDLSHISFGTLKNRFTIRNGRVTIPPMEIHSSAINLSVQGIYGFSSGTDIGIEVPLRNPKKRIEREAKGLPPKKNKGIILNLRAKEDKDGKVKIVWDPLKKAVQPEDLDDN